MLYCEDSLDFFKCCGCMCVPPGTLPFVWEDGPNQQPGAQDPACWATRSLCCLRLASRHRWWGLDLYIHRLGPCSLQCPRLGVAGVAAAFLLPCIRLEVLLLVLSHPPQLLHRWEKPCGCACFSRREGVLNLSYLCV